MPCKNRQCIRGQRHRDNKICPCRELAEAFSHYSYHVTEGFLLVCNLQGYRGPPPGQYGDKWNFTDPAIHSKTHRYGVELNDFGILGMIRFFESHTCNGICRRLGLEDSRKVRKNLEA